MNQYSPLNVDKEDVDGIYKKLIEPGDTLYDPKYLEMDPEDIVLDMKYFNNASSIIFAYKAKNFGRPE